MTTAAGVTEERRQAATELVQATRRLMLAAATSQIEPDEVNSVREQMDQLSVTLERQTRDRVLRNDFGGPAQARAAGRSIPWKLFQFNPMAAPLELSIDDNTARASLIANALFEGPHDFMHGGFSAHLMDCMLGTLVQARGRRALTASLELRYRRPTPLDQPLELFAQIVRQVGRNTIVEGWIDADGRRCVEAQGVFTEKASR